MLRKEETINPDDYIRLFRIEKMTFLMGELWLAAYRNIGVLYTSKDNVQISYVPKKSLPETEKTGLEIYRDIDTYNKFKQGWQEYTVKAKEFFGSLSANLSGDDASETIKILTESFTHYSKTEFIYVDTATKLKTVESEQILADFGDFKNSAREFLNQMWLGSNSTFGQLVKQLSKQFDIPEKDLADYTPKEILELFEGKRTAQEKLQERREDYVNTETLLSGKRAQVILEIFYPNQKKLDTFTGIIAQKGKVTAPVWIIPQLFGEYDELKNKIEAMPKGHILLAETTSPDLILACKKASAIITDQGGLMSHAAVVARELKIPCIVGLQNSMNFIKNGDMVEVDADNGIVRIIN